MPCPLGQLNDFEGKSECFGCPLFSTTISTASESQMSCFCEEGYYGKPFLNESCQRCSLVPGMQCPQNSSYPASILGYFKNPADPNIILECHPKESCLSSNSSFSFTTCNIGYTGWVCGSCIDFEFYKSGANCVECPSLAIKVSVYVVLILIAILVIRRMSSFDSFGALSAVKILLFWIQIIALFPSLSSNLTPFLRIFFAILSFVNLDIDIFFPGKHLLAL
jgi:hypothetical protein